MRREREQEIKIQGKMCSDMKKERYDTLTIWGEIVVEVGHGS